MQRLAMAGPPPSAGHMRQTRGDSWNYFEYTRTPPRRLAVTRGPVAKANLSGNSLHGKLQGISLHVGDWNSSTGSRILQESSRLTD